jgi:hypothetical protein
MLGWHYDFIIIFGAVGFRMEGRNRAAEHSSWLMIMNHQAGQFDQHPSSEEWGLESAGAPPACHDLEAMAAAWSRAGESSQLWDMACGATCSRHLSSSSSSSAASSSSASAHHLTKQFGIVVVVVIIILPIINNKHQLR